MNIDLELEHIIERYKLDRHYPMYQKVKKATEIIRTLMERESKSGQSIAVVGNDMVALRMIEGWNAGKCGIQFLKYNAVDDQEIQKTDWNVFDKIYIVSYEAAGDLLQYFSEKKIRFEWIYAILENYDLYLQDEFYRFFHPKMYFESDSMSENNTGETVLLYEYYFQKKFFSDSSDEMIKKRTQEKLFFLSLCMRNFICAKEHLENLKNYPEHNFWENCWQEIEKLLNRIHEQFQQQKQEHIIMYWIDSLSESEVSEMPYLMSRKAHSYYFTHAYTVTPFTFPTAKTMFCGIKQVDDLGYRVKRINNENSEVLRLIETMGYRFQVIGGYMTGLFEPQYSYKGMRKKDSSSFVLWNLMQAMLMAEGKSVFLAHLLIDIHPPALSVGMENISKGSWNNGQIRRQRYLSGKREIDRQLCFYDDLIGQQLVRIYMSDHGMGSFSDRFHVHLQIYHQNWKPRKIDRLYSHMDFHLIMKHLMKEGEIDENIFQREYAEIQDVDIYNHAIIRNRIQARQIPMDNAVGYKGIITKEILYVKHKIGTEWLIPWSEFLYEPSILQDDIYDNSLLEDFREMAGGFPKEIESDEKFDFVPYTYQALKNIKSTLNRVKELLGVIFERYSEHEIALRMGGWHSARLFFLLSPSDMKKIGCIIDWNENCECKGFGFPIVKPKEKLSKKIHAIVLSSYFLKEDLKTEIGQFYQDREVIDLYQIFEDHGLHFNREFIYGLDTDYDIEIPTED